jgi:3-oxoacyl-[acyl-carrier protein] reductase
MNLKGKTAIVTGGTRGIGRAISEALLRDGLSVCISARNQAEIDKAIRELGENAFGFVCDVRDYEQVKSLMAYTIKELGGLDILVNNAGIGMFETVEETSAEDFRAVLETNLFGVFYCCHEAIPEMRRRGVATSSTSLPSPARIRIRAWPRTMLRSSVSTVSAKR